MSFQYEDSIEIAAPPEAVYAIVSDVTRTGEWSPICHTCEWDDGGTGAVGDTFTGHNRVGEREWSTTSTVRVADAGRAFGWIVGDDWVRWTYTFEPTRGPDVDPGGTRTRLIESWHFTDAGLAMFDERFGERAPAQVEDRIRAAHTGIPATLAAIKRIAEA